jgi:hypothetical protein
MFGIVKWSMRFRRFHRMSAAMEMMYKHLKSTASKKP